MITLTNLGKHYGDRRALGPVTFGVEKGSAVGVLGLNGAGKTTLLRILACDLRPTSGAATVAGIDVMKSPHDVRRIVGYAPETPPLYGDMTVREYLRFVGRIKGLDPRRTTTRVEEVEEVTGLSERDGDPIRHLSHGYRQRVALAQAIVHDPEVLILDEPTSGLDPMQIGEIRELIRWLRGSRTILVSSHILPEISETCDEIVVLNRGEVVASGSEDELSDSVLHSRIMTVDVRAFEAARAPIDPADVIGVVSDLPHVQKVVVERRGSETFTLRVEGMVDVRAQVCRALVEAGHDVLRVDRARRELEQVFVELVEGASA
jgi:ABC-2 type transport system ATP-binding protein